MSEPKIFPTTLQTANQNTEKLLWLSMVLCGVWKQLQQNLDC